jgi:hypothetical protein
MVRRIREMLGFDAERGVLVIGVAMLAGDSSV